MLRTLGGESIPVTADRPTYAPSPSICRRLRGFETVDQYPIRSPLAVADFLAPIVAGRGFTEIGTRNGDIMGCLSHFARRVTAIELDVTYCKKLRARGFSVICRAVESVTPAELAAAEGDVYFWWPMWAPRQNEAWLRQMISAHRENRRVAAVYIAHDVHWKPDMLTLRRLTRHYHATNVTKLFFDEGDVSGYGRPGQWGVFHMARFELGPHVPLPPWEGSNAVPERWREGKPAEAEWLPGFCGVTENLDGSMTDACERSEQGSLPLGPKFNIRTRQACVDFCFSRCRRCRYVSFSKEMGDCSWYERCDMTSLRQNINGGPALPIVTRRVEAAAESSKQPASSASVRRLASEEAEDEASLTKLIANNQSAVF